MNNVQKCISDGGNTHPTRQKHEKTHVKKNIKKKKKFLKIDKNGQRFVTRVTSTIHMKLGPEINYIYTGNSAVFHKKDQNGRGMCSDQTPLRYQNGPKHAMENAVQRTCAEMDRGEVNGHPK